MDHPSLETDDLIAYHYERSKTPELALPFLERGAREARSRGGLEDARAHIERALGVCDDGRARGRLLFDAEELAALAGDTAARLGALEALDRLSRDDHETVLGPEVSLRRASAAFDDGDLAGARDCAQEALVGFEAFGDVSKQGDAHRLLGREAHQRGDHDAADERYAAALEFERRAGDRWGEAEILDLRGMLQVDRDEYEPAVESFDRALQICEELDDPLLGARALSHRATALRWMGSLGEAEETASRAVVRARSGGSPRTVASCELVLGGIRADAGRRDEAAELLRRTLRAAARMERPAFESQVWLELAWLEDGPEAARSAQEAARKAAQAELVHVEILAGSRTAELALESGDAEGSERAAAEAAERLARLGSIVGPEERVLLAHARALAALGREDEARDVMTEVRRIVSERAGRIRDPKRKSSYLRRYSDGGDGA